MADAPPTIEELLAAASGANGPRLVAESDIKRGGIDPLGLLQINLGLLDEVLPELNNTAAHVRPYVLMAWAWRRVRRIVAAGGHAGADDEAMRDFVDRIEAIYAWSQFLKGIVGLPGRLALRPLLDKKSYRFGGQAWEELRDMRRTSTGLISPLNYGPTLRTLGWLTPIDGRPGLFQPPDALDPVLDAFEGEFAGELGHAAFNRFGAVTVARDDVERWGRLWSLAKPLKKEKAAAFERLGGKLADSRRQAGIALVRAAWRDLDDDEATIDVIRARMADLPGEWDKETPPALAGAWRAAQVRQAFRLALESLFFWTIDTLAQKGPMRSTPLSRTFLEQIGGRRPATAAAWLLDGHNDDNPTEHIDALEAAQGRRADLPAAIAAALRHTLREPPTGHVSEWPIRLPLSRAQEQARQWAQLSPLTFLVKLIEVWVIAQHTYWSVTRGLTDARGRGKTILRMRIVMEEGGWTLTRGTSAGTRPDPTPDRLGTAVSLLWECDQLN